MRSILNSAPNSLAFNRSLGVPAPPAVPIRGTSVLVAAVLLFASLAAFVIGLSLGAGRLRLASHMAASCFFCGALYFCVIRGVGASYSPKILFFVNAMAPGSIAIFCLASSLGGDHLFPWHEALFERPLQSAFGLLSVPLGVAAVYLVRRVLPSGETGLKLRWIADAGGEKLEPFLILAAFVNLSVWFAVLDLGNPIFYLLRVLRSALSFGAFAAGFCAFRFKWATVAWVISLSLGLFGSLLTGGRGPGFIPIGLFFLGMLFGAPSKRGQVRLILVILPLAFALLVLSGFIGSLREMTGRRNLAVVLEEGSILEGDDDLFSNAGMIEEDSFIFRGLRRIVSWPPAVVPAMTPDPIPYRGFRDIAFEFQDAFNVRIFDLVAAGGRRGELDSYWGEISLLSYGFAVSETSSVEFGILSDGYTRGGWWVAFSYGIVATVILLALESSLRKLLLPGRATVFAMMLCVLAGYAAISFQLNPLIAVVRTIILNTSFALAVFMAFDIILKACGYKPAAQKRVALPTL